MPKRIGFLLALIAACVMTTSAFAQAPEILPLPATRTRINFAPGTSAYTFTTYLAQGVSQGYVLRVAAGQMMYITQTGSASIEVLDPLDGVAAGASTAPGPWGFRTTVSGDYTVVVYGQGYGVLTIYIPPTGSSTQIPVPLPLNLQRIRFAPGSAGYNLATDLDQGQPAAYVLGIAAGQQLGISTQGNVTVSVLDPQGNVMLPVTPLPAQRQFAIPQTGDYTLVLLGSGTAWISINIPPLAGAPPPPQDAQRIMFAPGADSATIMPTLVAGAGQSYMLGIARGQMLYISTSEGTTFTVYDPQGNQAASSTWLGEGAFNIMQDGDYTVTFYGQGPTVIRFQIPPLQ